MYWLINHRVCAIIISFPFFVTFLPHVSPPDFSFENKNSTCLFVQCILNDVERGVIFPNVEKQHGLETLLLSKLLFSKYLPQHLLIIANNEEIHHFTSNIVQNEINIFVPRSFNK